MVTRSCLAAGEDGKWDQLPGSPVFIWNSSPTKEGEGAGGAGRRSWERRQGRALLRAQRRVREREVTERERRREMRKMGINGTGSKGRRRREGERRRDG